MKKSLIAFLLLILGSASVAYYFWSQATKLPDWYVSKGVSSDKLINLSNEVEVQAVKTKLQEKIDTKIEDSINARQEVSPKLARLDGYEVNTDAPQNTQAQENSRPIQIDLSEKDFNELVVSSVAENRPDSKVLETTKGFNTTIKDGNLESGAVINVSEIPKEKLEQREKAFVEKITKTFPFLENQDVYIGIEGKPKVENGQLKFEEDTRIKLGNLSLTISELSQKLGIPEDKIKERLKLELELGKLKISDIEFNDNNALIKGSVN